MGCFNKMKTFFYPGSLFIIMIIMLQSSKLCRAFWLTLSNMLLLSTQHDCVRIIRVEYEYFQV